MTPQQLTDGVLAGGLGLGLALGALAQSTRFCTMGALADWYAWRGRARLMMWVLAVAVAAAGSMGLVALGLVDATRANAWSPRLLWLSCGLGGAVFGYGMVIASGCPQRNLVRAGAGSLKAWVTLLTAGLFAQMTLRGVLAVPRVSLLDAAGIDLQRPQDIGSLLAPWLHVEAGWLRAIALAAMLGAAAMLLWRARHDMAASHWLGGAGVGLLVVAGWYLTGHVGYIAEHPETLEPAWLGTGSHRPESLSFAAPIAHGLDLLTLWSDRGTTLSFGITVSLGVLLGSLLSALWRRDFRIESFRDPGDLLRHAAGGALMGFGGVTAMGCSIGQGISGVSLLSVGSAIALAGIVAGAWLAFWQQSRDVDRAGC